jgi:uncharacterized iron-regulated membrane protein
MPSIPTQPISMEMHLIIAASFLVFSLAIGGLGYFIKCNFERMLKRLDEISRQRVECRETLPDRFADRAETRDAIQRLHGRTDDHDHRITVLEGKVGL